MTDLKTWKMHLPIDNNGLKVGNAKQVTNLVGFEYPPYFMQNPDGSLVFSAPVDGAKTSKNTKYARSELREMKGTSEAAWTMKTGGTMEATLRVDRVPTLKDGKPGRVIIGQIHGKSEELIRLYRGGDGYLYFHCDRYGPKNTETVLKIVDAKGKQPNVALGESFSYKIVAKGSDLLVSVSTAGGTYLYSGIGKVNSIWQKDKFYFKVGIYLGVNATQGTGDGQVTLINAVISH